MLRPPKLEPVNGTNSPALYHGPQPWNREPKLAFHFIHRVAPPTQHYILVVLHLIRWIELVSQQVHIFERGRLVCPPLRDPADSVASYTITRQ